MTYADRDSLRSMEVEWEDEAGKRQHWSSTEEAARCGWYEAERLLPSSASDISIQFRCHGDLGIIKEVGKVDRHRGCAWVTSDVPEQPQVEVIRIRADGHSGSSPVDAIFELTGSVLDCHVSRAVNVARQGPAEPWEFWEDEQMKPQEEPPLMTIRAADGAALPSAGLKDPRSYMAKSTLRLGAAVRKMVEIHRCTLEALRVLDRGPGGEVPAAEGGAATRGTAPPLKLHRLKQQMATEVWNMAAVAELESKWLKACKDAGQVLTAVRERPRAKTRARAPAAGPPGLDAAAAAVGAAGQDPKAMEAIANDANAHADNPVTMSGFRIHGWCTTKFGQEEARAKIAEVTASILCMQRWLAGLRRLECPICLEDLLLAERVLRCLGNWHHVHEACLREWAAQPGREGAPPACPACGACIVEEAGPLHDSTASGASADPPKVGWGVLGW